MGIIVLLMIIIVLLTKLIKRWIFPKIVEEAEEPTVHNDEDIYMESSLLDLNGADNYERKVKKITRYYTDIDGENVIKAGICYVINYNKNRKTEDLLEFDRKGKEIKHLIYEYDKNGNLIFVKDLNKKGEKGVVDCYIYNDKGQHVETKYFDDGQIDYDTCYKYDENGNCIEVNTDDYRLDGIVVKTRNVSVFDDREIERIKYEGLTGETEKEVYFYNKNGDLKEIQNIDIETGEIISRDLYCYDTDGKLSEILTYEGSDVVGKWTYSYNQQGKETECRIYDGLGNLTHKHVSIYDERGSFCGTKKYKNGILIFSYLDEIEYYD
jgi:hypothetical protein